MSIWGTHCYCAYLPISWLNSLASVFILSYRTPAKFCQTRTLNTNQFVLLSWPGVNDSPPLNNSQTIRWNKHNENQRQHIYHYQPSKSLLTIEINWNQPFFIPNDKSQWPPPHHQLSPIPHSWSPKHHAGHGKPTQLRRILGRCVASTWACYRCTAASWWTDGCWW